MTDGLIKLAIVGGWAVAVGLWQHNLWAGVCAFWLPTIVCYVGLAIRAGRRL